jgi:hypothetical protein
MSDPTDKDPPDHPVGQSPVAQSPEGGRDLRREQAQRLFEMGQSLRVIGSQVGVSGTMVGKWAKEGGWIKGEAKAVVPAPRPKPPAPTVSKVTAIRPGIVVPPVDSDVVKLSPVTPVDSPEMTTDNQSDNQRHDLPLDQRFRQRVIQLLENPTRDEAADVAARAVVQVIKEHRVSITKAQMLCERLLGQLDVATLTRGELEEFIVSVTEPGKYRSMLMKMVQLPAHAGVLRDIATAQVKLVTLERQAFGLATNDDPTPAAPPADAAKVESTEYDRIRERVQLRLAGTTT